MDIRKACHDCLHDPFNSKAKIFNGFISFVIVFSVAILPLMFLQKLYPELQEPLLVAEKITITIFLAEYFLRIWSEKNPFKFIFSWNGLIDVLAIIPFFLEQYIDSPYIWIFSLLRILRILKFVNILEFEQRALADPTFNPCKKVLKLEGEKIIKIVYKHPLMFLGNLLAPILLLSLSFLVLIIAGLQLWSILVGIFIIALAGVLFFKIWLDFNYDILLVTNLRVIIQDYQLFGSTANAVGYHAILNIVPDNRGFFNWLINVGKINIETAADQKPLSFMNLKNAHKVAQVINQYRTFVKAHPGKEIPRDLTEMDLRKK